MTNGDRPPRFDLTRRVHDIVVTYVLQRTDDRSAVKWKDLPLVRDPATGKDRRDILSDYRDAREKVCREAFLAMRARRSREDFVDYFVGTVCAVPQYLPAEDFRELGTALLWDDMRWEDVKALAMLTLSSMARV